eukprot:ANDGO_07087.mRNA.1 putative ubiquitin carboxyl-terminal hydrolase
MSERVWIPLEANPDVLNGYLGSLGVDPSNEYSFVDVYGLDSDLLQMVPQPVIAVLLLFPINSASEDARKKQNEELDAENFKAPDSLLWVPQYVGNACGTIALVHALANNRSCIPLSKNSLLENLISVSCSDASSGAKEDPAKLAEERAKLIAKSEELDKAHDASARAGQSSVPDEAEALAVNLHFVCFVMHEGTLYELDGRKRGPIPHGPCADASMLLERTAEVIKREFMVHDPESIQFTLVALAKSSPNPDN